MMKAIKETAEIVGMTIISIVGGLGIWFLAALMK